MQMAPRSQLVDEAGVKCKKPPKGPDDLLPKSGSFWVYASVEPASLCLNVHIGNISESFFLSKHFVLTDNILNVLKLGMFYRHYTQHYTNRFNFGKKIDILQYNTVLHYTTQYLDDMILL